MSSETAKSTVKSADKQKVVVVVDPVDRHAALIVRGAIVCTGIAGLAMIARSLRLFTKFEHVRQIPTEFVRKQMKLAGTLKSVQLDGSMRIDHQPILRAPQILPRRRLTDTDGLLTIRPAGIEMTDAGRCFLRENYALLEKPIYFTLIKPTSGDVNSLDCDLFVKKGRFRSASLNKELIRRGLARVPGADNHQHLTALHTVPAYSRLVNQLLLSEQIADRRGVGMWERDTWVESMRALPYQMGEMVRSAAITRLILLTASGTKNAVVSTYRAAQSAFDFGVRVGRWIIFQSQRASAAGRRLTSSAEKTS
uniref:TNase-like domain-containing protein n=1 Tax=Plectus sambesii TaxID=2011161 RepID=A0A914WKR0_9BILA